MTLSATCDDHHNSLDFDLEEEDPSTSFQSANANLTSVFNTVNQTETQQLLQIMPDASSNTSFLFEETLSDSNNCHTNLGDKTAINENNEEDIDSLNGCNVQPDMNDSSSSSSNSQVDNNDFSSLESDSSTEFLDNNYDSSSTDSDLEDEVPDNYDDKDKTPKLSEFDEECMTLLSFVLKHHLSWQASIDFIELFGIFNMTDKEITLDKIKQRVGATKPNIIDFCERCYTLFPEDEDIVVCSQENCGGLRFKGHITRQSAKNRKSYFACLPLKMQIQDILEREGVWDSICNYRKKCQEATSVTDILNGEIYRLLSGPGNILESENYITLLFNTDGVPLYKSSGISIWPVYLVINELHPVMRFSRKNMILWGVWQAKGKPMFQTFFQPFITQMISLKNEGIQVKLNKTETKIRAVLLAGTLDLQAKAIVAEMTQHNGQYGCITCEEPGEVVKHGKGHCRVYPFRENSVTARTSSGVLQNGLQAMANRNSKTTVKGIKGVSCLHGMNWFDLVFGLVPDYMHGALLGVKVKKMLQLLFASSNSKKPFFIGNHIKEVDKFLKKMQPTDDISRLPRPLEKNLHHLKASELEVWLLFYSLPCLIDFLKPAYLNHLALMVEGIYILLGDDINAIKLNRAERVLSEFYHLFSDLYGYENCTLNLHNVGQHLTDYVRKLGPVWAWSCFPFEDMNGAMLEYAHGTGDVCIQILWTIQAQKRLAIDAPSISNDLLRNYVQKMVKAGRSVKAKFEAKNCGIAGGMKPLVLCQEMTDKLKAALNISEDEEVGEINKALRIIIKDTIFFSKQYSRMKKRIAHTVLIRDIDVVIARIQYFIYHKNSKMCFAVVNKLEMTENPLLHPLVNHFICLKLEENQNEEMNIIPVDTIREKVLVLNGNKNYSCVCRLPNLYKQSV